MLRNAASRILAGAMASTSAASSSSSTAAWATLLPPLARSAAAANAATTTATATAMTTTAASKTTIRFASASPSSGNSLVAAASEGAKAVTRGLIVDTLGLMKSLEASGLTRAQAEELTTTLTQVLCLNRERISEGFVAKSALEKVVLEHEARVAALRSEVTKGQELHLASLARDTERLTASLDRVRSEIRTEADKLTAATRLDLNLEKGRMRDELQALRDKAAELEIKIDKETSALKAMLESTKSEMVRYSLGLLLSASAVGATIFRLFSSK